MSNTFHKTTKNIYIYIYFFIFVNNINISKTSEDQKHILVIPFRIYYPKITEGKSEQEKLLNSWLRQKLYLSLEN